MVPVLYMHEFSPAVRAVLLTAEALNIKIDKKIVDLSKKEHLTDNYLKINPQHTIPCLDDNGTIIWDSHAINAYLVEKYGRDDSLYPKDLAKRAQVDQRLHFDSGVLFSWLKYIGKSYKYKGLKALTNDQIDAIIEGYDHLNTFLKGNKWVTGDTITIADFSLIGTVTSLNLLYPVDKERYPNVVSWLQRAETLPYYSANNLESFKKMFHELIKH